jgi:hypothetical protein
VKKTYVAGGSQLLNILYESQWNEPVKQLAWPNILRFQKAQKNCYSVLSHENKKGQNKTDPKKTVFKKG